MHKISKLIVDQWDYNVYIKQSHFSAFLIDRIHLFTNGKPRMLYMSRKLMTSATRLNGNLLL